MKKIVLAALLATVLIFCSCDIFPSFDETTKETLLPTESTVEQDLPVEDDVTVKDEEEGESDPTILETDKSQNDTEDEVDTTKTTETETVTECNHTKTVEVVDTAASCSAVGIKRIICGICGELLDRIETDLLEHTPDEWTVTLEPTAEEKGVKSTSCTKCGATMVEEIDAIGYSEGLEYRSNGNRTCAVVSRGSCKDAVISIPGKSPDGDKVTSIASNAFYEDETIKSLYLPATLEEIGDCAFCYAFNLEKVYFPEKLKTIGREAFRSCNFEALTIPETVEVIDAYAFNNNIKLKEVTLPEGLIMLGYEAFAHCYELKSFHIPASVKKVGDSVVSAYSINSITVAEGNENFTVVNNCLISHDGVLIVGYGDCSVPDGIVRIGNAAFDNNTSLTDVKLPSSLEYIGADAFMGTNIKEIVIPSKVYSIASYAFLGCKNLEKVTLSNGVRSIGENIFDWCDKLSEIRFYGSEEDWESIDIDVKNEVLFKANLTFVDGVSPETVRGYGRTTISGNVLYVYDLLAEAVMKDVPDAKIELDRTKGVVEAEVIEARAIFFSDHPQCFWWGGACAFYKNDQGIISAIEPNYLYTGDALTVMRARLQTVVDKIIASVPDGNDYEKALYLHDKVADTVTYKETSNDQNPYGALVEGEAVCNGYATAYQLLLMECGIRAWTVNGSAEGVPHAWNVVWMDDETCVYTDVTWDDQQDDAGVIFRFYFNMSLDEIDDDHSVSEYFRLPECGHTDESYIDVSTDYDLLTDDDGAEVLAEYFGEAVDGKRSAHFVYNGADFDAWLEKNISELGRLLDGKSVSYTMSGNEIVVFVEIN